MLSKDRDRFIFLRDWIKNKKLIDIGFLVFPGQDFKTLLTKTLGQLDLDGLVFLGLVLIDIVSINF